MVLMELQDLSTCLDGLFAAGPDAWADGESVQVLEAQLARLEALVTAAAARFDRSGEWSTDGARDAAGWLRTRCRLSAAQARRHHPGVGTARSRA